ncbi:MAG: NAD(P)H-hydrate dehydratase [Candidatus Thermoplasmatota archaeon]|nr:NAD(P)H-hydrate dehydratase [Candidatus Thermoplasmatota archaeon]
MIDLRHSKRMDINHYYLTGESFSLMDSAGRAISDYAVDHCSKGERILIVCGPGNNGGDGFSAASHLESKADFMVVSLVSKEMYTGDARKALMRYSGPVAEYADLRSEIDKSQYLIDALFGTGLSRTPTGVYREAIEAMNASGKEILSVDIPSGMGTDISIHPACTLTFQDIKQGMSVQNCGKIQVVKLNYHEKSENYSGPGDFVYFPYPKKDSHKGMNGIVAVVAGWEFPGSSLMAAQAAAAMGADLVKIYWPAGMAAGGAISHPSTIFRNVDDLKDPYEEIGNANCILLGPGIGKSQKSMDFMEKILQRLHNSTVIDADGIYLLSKKPHLSHGKNSVITPHSAEFKMLTGEEATPANAAKTAKSSGSVILLKQSTDVITDGTRTILSDGGNPRLTMGGTGDILAGMVASLMARGTPPLWASSLSSFVLKRTGDELFREKSLWYDQFDLIRKIPDTMAWVEGLYRAA